jgi:hypothetical protein
LATVTPPLRLQYPSLLALVGWGRGKILLAEGENGPNRLYVQHIGAMTTQHHVFWPNNQHNIHYTEDIGQNTTYNLQPGNPVSVCLPPVFQPQHPHPTPRLPRRRHGASSLIHVPISQHPFSSIVPFLLFKETLGWLNTMAFKPQDDLNWDLGMCESELCCIFTFQGVALSALKPSSPPVIKHVE